VFIGNAAHTLHPVAGQGLNLGMRDVAALAETLDKAYNSGDIGNVHHLQAYIRQRNGDLQQTAVFTDSLIRVFANDFPPLAIARNIGLSGLNACPALKHLLMRHTAGLAQAGPRLARGLPVSAQVKFSQ
jgi:2-octaprenyl-6-methoxyphenol hydroxylase